MPEHQPENRAHTLLETGRYLHAMGFCSQPLEPWKVLDIERRALRRVRTAIKRHATLAGILPEQFDDH